MADNNENVSLTDIENESQMNIELSGTESKIMSEGIHSTPVLIKKSEENDMMKMMQLLFNEQSVKWNKFDEKFNKFDVMLNKFDVKLDEQKSNSNLKYDKTVSYTHLDVYKRQEYR